MSTVVLNPAEQTRPGDDRRRRLMLIAAIIAAIVVAGLVTWVALRHSDEQYGPIEGGNTAGPYTLHNIVFSKDGSSMSLPVTQGVTAQFFELVANNGSHSVEIKSIPTDSIVSETRWSVYQAINSHTNLGENEPFHSFPAIVPAHGELRILITIHRPLYCSGRPEGVEAKTIWDGLLNIKWQSLLGSHTTTISFPSGYGIQVC